MTFPELESASLRAVRARAADRIAAYHEAGHAVVALALDVPIAYATVQHAMDAEGPLHGRVVLGCHSSTLSVSALVTIKMAGASAEGPIWPAGQLYYDALSWHTDDTDREQARSILAAFYDAPETSRVVQSALKTLHLRSAAIVERHWSWVERVAEQLQRWRRLTGAEAMELRP